jgi:hypothetical protein
MARKLRLQYPGAIYHVLNRGDCREDDALFRPFSSFTFFLSYILGLNNLIRR